MTGRAEGPGAAGEHHQPLLPTPGTPKTGESAARVAAVEIALDDFLDDRPKISALNRFAPEDCKACTPARTDLHRRRGSRRNGGKAPGKDPSAPDVEDDRLPPWREKRRRKRANVTEETGAPLERRHKSRRGRGNQVGKRQPGLTLDGEHGNGRRWPAAFCSGASAGYSDASRPGIPTESGHPFRGKAATYSDRIRPLLGGASE
jgi:hypothetical protein